MTHEFKDIVQQANSNQQNDLRSVLATIVYLEGSSYRKPGVRMLISENGKMVGAVSGGCVENEVKRQAESVFQNGNAKIITYDGRYRLGCEGILYILIEPFSVSDEFLNSFNNALESREKFKIGSYYIKEDQATGKFGSVVYFNNKSSFAFNDFIDLKSLEGLHVFSQTMKPSTKLLIIGGEHDAVKLCNMASSLGWEVDVVTSIKDPKLLSDFPGATSVSAQTPEIMDFNLDNETVVVLMTHNYAQDLQYLLKLASHTPRYIGILGSAKRRDQLQGDLFNYKDDLTEEFLSTIYSPAGLNIGAITPEEIALSIISEILTVVRETKPKSLRSISGKIHTP
ncbi:MAG: XdhC family protein [Bacteroidia bacterium]|nr:XdhC family protein [Bacteroidia bacterium]NNK26883.1 XdhC family protein [Flavobacteriaceae bacterium]